MLPEPPDPSSWRLRPAVSRPAPIGTRSPYILSLPSQPPPPSSSPTSFVDLHAPSHPNSLPAPIINAQPPSGSSVARKRQYRFSVSADIDLLQLVAKHNPYGAPHGGRLHKWQAVADTLKECGIDIDFRRARDRTALLIEHWRKQDLSLLRRTGSGNLHDQAIKEKLLQSVSELEHSAKPRDNLTDWRAPSRLITNNRSPSLLSSQPAPPDSADNHHATTAVAAAAAHAAAANIAVADNPPDQNNNHSLSHMSDPTANNSNMHPSNAAPLPFPTSTAPLISSIPSPLTAPQPLTASNPSPAHHAALPPLVSQRDVIVTPDTQVHSLQYNVSPSHHPEKLIKGNDGKRLAPQMPHQFFPPAISRVESARASDIGVTHREPPLFPSSAPQMSMRQHNSAHIVDPINPSVASSSPQRIAPQNIQLVAPSASQNMSDPSPVDTPDAKCIYSHLVKVENLLQDYTKMVKQRIDLDEQRFMWEHQRETKRIQMEKERIEKEYKDREEEREERRKKEMRDKQERDRLLDLLARSARHATHEADQPD